MDTPAAIRWDELMTDRPMPLIDRQRIIGSNVMISRVVLHKGFVVAAHHHANEQMAVVLSGLVRFMVGPVGGSADRELVLGPGQVLHIPPHAPHSAEALERTEILDVFSPVSERTGVDRAGR